ncbi:MULTISPECIES: hypothetical protein [unclassified Mesorhizobium]|uniref:hypothetical protein n=1 Tax=unclassified Mesorhizobium TaxID=325217 RepID=UPI0010929232|nr:MULTISPECIES: hypothetical protein [unclassified Mesorhizobium]TGQ45469.1 hypothetical protein EN857_01945 [Mesorhizobium sp. M4B.F.Ca.ET.214.01.1.1]TGQ63098.1 hypothetical protein EN854_01945 [Mesorhizobium sp. M4B.F.Ca.ET.211.01.1.1]TGU40736.1 hypothetical protein EN793_01945 [Mesorhizobium sp. M4B.F.Ca.ET.150.01.1.1]
MPKSTDKSQIEKFRDAARELKTDQSEAVFEADVQKIAKAPKLSNEEIKELARRQRGGSKP